jgi:hypothetical protein
MAEKNERMRKKGEDQRWNTPCVHAGHRNCISFSLFFVARLVLPLLGGRDSQERCCAFGQTEEKRRGGSGAKFDGAVPARGWAPKRDISRLGTLGRRRNARSLRGSRSGSGPERVQTGHERKASPRVQRRRPASFPKRRLRPPMGGRKSFRP